MGESEIEEGVATTYMDTDQNIDVDVFFSRIDDRIQDILGHHRKYFESGVSADTLGARFGGYGSFLPTYQRFPSIQSNPRTQQKAENKNIQASSHDDQQHEGATWNSTVSSNETLTVRPKPASSSAPQLHVARPSSVDRLVKIQRSSEYYSNCAPVKVPSNQSVQNRLKFRIKVGLDNGFLAQKNAAMYSNLGLDMSPSSSSEDSPTEWGGDFSDSLKDVDSPSRIVRIMTSFPIPNGVLLSPLHDSLINLLEAKDLLDYNTARPVQESFAVCADQEVPGEKKSKSCNKSGMSVESKKEHYNDSSNCLGACLKKEVTMETSKINYMLSVASKEITKVGEVADGKGRISEPNVNEVKTELLGRKTCKIDKLNAKATLTVKVEKDKKLRHGSRDARSKVDKNVDSCCDMPEGMTDCRGRTKDFTGQKFEQKSTSCLQDEVKLSNSGEQPSSAGRKNSQGSHYNCSSSTGKLNNTMTINVSAEPKDKIFHERCFPSKHKGDDKVDKDSKKVKVRYTDLIGGTKVGRNESESHLLGTPIEDKAKKYKLESQKKLAFSNKSKKRSCGKNTAFLSTSKAELNGDFNDVTPIAGPRPGEVAPLLIQENWVCCDSCHTWRLLPYETNPDHLPKKWLCSMLSWLPGMNQCGVSEEETTNALRALYQIPVPENHYVQQSYPVFTASSVTMVDTQHNLDQNPQGLSFSNGKKKLGTKKLYNPVQHGASMKQVNSIMKNELAIVKSKNLQNSSLFPSESKVEKRSGHVKPLKVKGNRDADQDEFKLSKKVKKDGLHHVDKDQNIGGLSKKEVEINNKKYSKYSSSDDIGCVAKDGIILSIDKPNNQVQKIMVMENQGKIDIAGKKRNSKDKREKRNYLGNHPSNGHNLEANCISMEEMSQSEYRTKKKSRISRSEERDSNASTSNCKPDGKGQRVSNPTDHISLYKESNNGEYGPLVQYNANNLSHWTDDDKNSSRRDFRDGLHCTAATSSSSMISSTCKVKINYKVVKSSPVESVCSSPSRISKQGNPGMSMSRKDGGLNDGLSHLSGQKRSSEAEIFGGTDESEMVAKVCNTHHRSKKSPFFDCHNEVTGDRKCKKVTSQTDHSSNVPNIQLGSGCINSYDNDNKYSRKLMARNHSRELERVDSHHYAEPSLQKSGNGCSSGAKVKLLTSMSNFDMGRIKVSESHSEQNNSYCVKFEGGKEAHDFSPKEKSRENYISMDDKLEENFADQKVHSIKCSNDSDRSDNQFESDALTVDGSDCDDLRRTPKHIGKNDSQNGLKDVRLRNPSPDMQEPTDIVAPNHIREDYFSWAASSALKEAKTLKHSADHLKISGSGLESTELFFQAALKFFHGASLLNPAYNESANHGEMTSAEMYGTTAKLCEYCACEYERCNDMASAALAYKCMEVAYMRVVFSTDFTASRDRKELQMALQQVSPVESPSSPASDVDNLNNEFKVEKMHAAKDVRPQAAGDLVITARNRANFIRLLNFAQHVNLAMEASRKSQIAFAAAKMILEETGNMEGFSFIKKVLDVGFHDVKGLLQLIRLAMESLSRTP